jgi:hypothetical protein
VHEELGVAEVDTVIVTEREPVPPGANTVESSVTESHEEQDGGTEVRVDTAAEVVLLGFFMLIVR